MRSVPRQEYHRETSRQGSTASTHPTNLGLLAVIGDQELPDATLTLEQREFLKEEVRAAEVHLSTHELMYLACALEAAATRRRFEEEGEKSMRRMT